MGIYQVDFFGRHRRDLKSSQQIPNSNLTFVERQNWEGIDCVAWILNLFYHLNHFRVSYDPLSTRL